MGAAAMVVITLAVTLGGALSLTACSSLGLDLTDATPPGQRGKSNSMAARGARSFAQRQRDCWDIPSAQACYEVGLNYELGLAVEPDRATALRYYDKACDLERQPDHCRAADRLRHGR